jgi:hypothetical protein
VYRVTGLTSYNLERLRITLKANPPSNGVIDLTESDRPISSNLTGRSQSK